MNGRNHTKEHFMSKKGNHEADIKNPNKGTDGTNKTHDKNQGNRGKQMDPNQQTKKK
jgi:hypothetical protein